MKNIIVIGLASAALAGCRSVTVKNYGQEVVDVNGVQTVISKGWYVSHWQHWMITKADNISASIKPDAITFGLNGLDEMPDGDGLAKVVTASLSGAAELATKVGAAIATAGGDGEDAQGKHLLFLKQSELLWTNFLSQLR